MSKSVSIPISLNELKRTSFRRHSSKKGKSAEHPLSGFIILVERQGAKVRLYGTSAEQIDSKTSDEIVAINEVVIEGKSYEEIIKYIQECIRTRVIQLKVQRKAPEEEEQGPSAEAVMTDAYLVSVNKEHTKEVISRLRRAYDNLKTYDMESIAEGKSMPNSPATSLRRPSVDNSDSVRFKQNDPEARNRSSMKMNKQKENNFLRSSLRSSKKLKALAHNVTGQTKVTILPNTKIKDASNTVANGYENQCYEQADTARATAGGIRKEKEDNNNESIPLKQVNVCVDRIAEHLSRLAGREEDSRVLREYFQSQPVQDAIQAAAIHRTSEKNAATKPSLANGKSEKDLGPEKERIRVVTLYKEEESYLGATVRNEDNRIVIGRVVKGGIVEKTGLFQEGDELLELNGVDLKGMSVGEVCEMLRNLSGDVKFVISRKGDVEKKVQPAHVQHLRAMFDYDPEDDVYVPCKELALKFNRGDVLHVLNTSDENWWQAYKDGEDFTDALAGLIPSSSFRQQVVMYNEEMEKEAKGKKDSTMKKKIPEVIRTLGRRESREIARSADEPGISGIGYHSELLTYEEVVLHLALTQRKRPLVLCGPEGVGCLELRQKLLESDKIRLASPVPFTSRPARDGELDGVHYHFISRQAFQEDSKKGKFVEYGEYQKHMYGTATADIVNVIKRGLTCVMVLKPESISAVRTSTVMPFVVFVAPPALQILRRHRECAGQFNVKDDELKAVLNNGKAIEQKFGHLFDAIIINTDFDRSLKELQKMLKTLETEPLWVPAHWVSAPAERIS